MLRPPNRSSCSPTTIHDLPDELCILIGAKFTHLRRNRDLANLSLVSEKWRAIAQEWLLKEPRFNLTHIDKYLWELGHHEHLYPQIHSLEIWSSSENRIPRDTTGVPTREYKLTKAPQWDPAFFIECKNVIRHWAKNRNYCVSWFTALHQDCIPALFYVLLCLLPNLEELNLGNTWLRDFPIFGNMLSPNVNASRTLGAPYGFEYMNYALDLLLPRLVVLEVPADISTVRVSMHATTLFNLHKFNTLKEVGITMHALWLRPSARRNTPPDPREIFPPSLEVLKISEVTWATLAFLKNLCLAKISGHYAALRRVEIYYSDPLDQVEIKYAAFVPQGRNLVVRTQKMCSDADVALYMYFPANRLLTWEIDGTPWQLREERDEFNLALERGRLKYIKSTKEDGAMFFIPDWSKAYEAEWDKDGDVVMEIQETGSK